MNLDWNKDPDTYHESDKTRYVLTAPKPYAGPGHNGESGIEITAGKNYNGSGPKAFGGAKEWPVATLKVAFQTGDIIERDKFIEALQKFTDDYFKP